MVPASTRASRVHEKVIYLYFSIHAGVLISEQLLQGNHRFTLMQQNSFLRSNVISEASCLPFVPCRQAYDQLFSRWYSNLFQTLLFSQAPGAKKISAITFQQHIDLHGGWVRPEIPPCMDSYKVTSRATYRTYKTAKQLEAKWKKLVIGGVSAL